MLDRNSPDKLKDLHLTSTRFIFLKLPSNWSPLILAFLVCTDSWRKIHCGMEDINTGGGMGEVRARSNQGMRPDATASATLSHNFSWICRRPKLRPGQPNGSPQVRIFGAFTQVREIYKEVSCIIITTKSSIAKTRCLEGAQVRPECQSRPRRGPS